MKKKICVVGAGRWGKNHVKTLFELDALGGIVEIDGNRRTELQNQYPAIPVFPDVEPALAQNFDGFTVAAPAAYHYTIAKTILENNKPVLVEKPMCLKLEDAEHLNKLAIKKNLTLMVGHVLLFHPAIQKIKELLQNGKIGKLQYIYSNRLNLGTVPHRRKHSLEFRSP